MTPKSRLGRNPFERSIKAPVSQSSEKSATTFLFHYTIELPVHGALLAVKACLLTLAVARELTHEARSALSMRS